MKVHNIMTTPAYTCKTDTTLAVASRRMAEKDCGMLIVLDRHGKPAGILTDRDIAMAIGTSDRDPSQLRADQAMTSRVYTCSPNDSLHAVLQLMSEAKIRRLPVVTADGDLRGVVSIDDVILWGVKTDGVTQGQLTRSLRAICGVHVPFEERREAEEPFEV